MFAADFHRSVGGRGAGEGVCPRAPAKTWGNRHKDADLHWWVQEETSGCVMIDKMKVGPVG